MLFLTRKIGEAVTIGDPKTAGKAIEVTVEDVREGSVRLGIVAPKETAVHRKEVWKDIQENGKREEDEPSLV